jgi:hypothetical protein
MLLKAARFAALVLASVNFGLAAAHLVEMGPKRRLSGPDWLTVQNIYTDFGKVARFTMPSAFLSELLAAVLARRRSSAVLTGAAALGTVGTVAIWRFLNEPVNREVLAWRPDSLPPDWKQRRDQWEFAHAASAVVHALGLGSLIAATLADSPADP